MSQTELNVRYQGLLQTASRAQWEKIGVRRRAGVATPLFSIFSEKSVGVGEIPDLRDLADWCSETGLSIIQLLPLNDIGCDFRPYDAQSVFALEPMYLSLEKLKGVNLRPFRAAIGKLRKKFPCSGKEFNPGIKAAKLELLRKIFDAAASKPAPLFRNFREANRFWIDDYALFKVITEKFQFQCWESWPEPFRYRDPKTLAQVAAQQSRDLAFHQWMQWQLFEQFSDAKRYAESRGVFLMGDMPYLGSRNSDYVWSHPDHFKLELSSGAPPDVDFARGQRWGMPPYNWEVIARQNYEYLIRKLQYAENFYHMYRIDHVVGIFRVWTISIHQPLQDEGMCGKFDPENPGLWEDHGRNLLSMMVRSTRMLPCAEDLGTVPDCAVKVMGELGIPGLDVQRWVKDWDGRYPFKDPQRYRTSSIAVLSTHDTSAIRAWWRYECGTANAGVFERWCDAYGIYFHAVKEQLFDLKKSKYGRLYWRPELSDRALFFRILGRQEHEVPVLAMLYDSSVHEQEQFGQFLGFQPGRRRRVSVEQRMTERCLESSSVFSIQMLQDWLSMDSGFREADAWHYRINIPATLNEENWRLRIPISLERLKKHELNSKIKSLVKNSQRG